MSKKTKSKTEVHEYQAEMQQLLEILVHSLYTEREIFLRELVSNSSDALSKVQLTTLTEEKVLDKDAELEIKITFDENKRKLEIEDSGCGMTKEELVSNLGTIANSGTLKFLQQAQAYESIEISRQGDLLLLKLFCDVIYIIVKSLHARTIQQ